MEFSAGIYYYVRSINVFFYICNIFSGTRGSFLVLSAGGHAGHAGGPPVHHVASLGPGRAAWAFRVTKSGKITGLLSAELEPTKTMENAHVGHRCKGKRHGSNNRFKLSSVLQLRNAAMHVWS